MIKLVEFLLACSIPINLESYKIHLATGYPDPPLDAFFEGRFKEWQEGQTRKNFPCDMVIGLIELRRNKWLFAGVYKILGYKEKNEGVEYSTELIDGQDDLIGRVVVHHERVGRQSYLLGKLDGGEFYISEIKEKRLSIEEFPGYDSVRLPFIKLKTIVAQQEPSWKSALSSVNGVYLIVDTETGKQYVGIATGDGGIWERWSNYTSNGNGGNVKLRELLTTLGDQYSENFQFSILEIADTHLTTERLLERESFWKNVLCTREFGYN